MKKDMRLLCPCNIPRGEFQNTDIHTRLFFFSFYLIVSLAIVNWVFEEISEFCLMKQYCTKNFRTLHADLTMFL